ncbi:DNA-methyltransferase [Moritella viscosa]|uniref:DNA-methyltransferase n=1 Tax=Moritella viscosa TaxID=80854 RepID=UPI000922B154|nr:site-specific DNA-methyltransferase [Moritella viscosa]SHO15761.1 M.BsiWI [Moritella viscosa]SHO16105.1 M.BsiWI [Moritella viscosa]
MSIIEQVSNYQKSDTIEPLMLQGDSLKVLSMLPDKCIDMCITSPPYWGQREYAGGGIGLEKKPEEFIDNLCKIFNEMHRVLKDEGSFWLNIGDSYKAKALQGIPWRVALKLCDEQGWILRNSVIWNKMKGSPCNSKDKLRNIHENVFHFVKKTKGYYYDIDAIRKKPRDAKVVNGAVVSGTGVTGVRYRRTIELSTDLNDQEKTNATEALDDILKQISEGKLSDFRMVIRGNQRGTHSDSEKVSGRAKELRSKGFYFLKYNPKGSKPSDVWDIIPEDSQKREKHYAPFPEDLCKIPILSTCPEDGIVLDPFAGTGTSLYVAKILNRKSIGIDISDEYIELAQERFTNV